MKLARGFAALSALLTFAVNGPAYAVSSGDLNQSISIGYGTVTQIGTERVDSNAPKGAVMGGIIGAATSGHHDRGKHAAIGALSGGVLASVMQGDRSARSYRVAMVTGAEKVIVTEQADIVVGDCVAIEEGRSANIRRVPSVHCEHHGHPAMAQEAVRAKASASADQCHAAKDMALQAATEDEIDVAMKKVRIFCD